MSFHAHIELESGLGERGKRGERRRVHTSKGLTKFTPSAGHTKIGGGGGQKAVMQQGIYVSLSLFFVCFFL